MARGLEGSGTLPFEVWIGRICEEFHCLPSEAEREWERAPSGYLESVIEARAFAEAWRIVKDAKSQADIPDGTLTDLALTIRREFDEQELRDLAAKREREAHG